MIYTDCIKDAADMTADAASTSRGHDTTSNCTLQIRNINKTHSGEYRFRFETDSIPWTGVPGMSIEVTTLKLSAMGLNVTGRIKEGDPVNLTCTANCTAFNSSEIIWFKDGKKLPETGPELLLTATSVTSGNYTCGWRNGGLRSNAFKMDVDSEHKNKWNSSLVIGGVCFAVFVATGVVVIIVIKRRRGAAAVLDNVSARSSKAGDPHASDYQNWGVDEDDADLDYASVSLQPKSAHNRCRGGQQQQLKNDGSVIYSTVAR
ncbi:uncharacterized protein LOC134448789 [Engraulis encrasicolus]|uniref:uncharacterized protein LOC134448789 n=1 Tax=Engraulis encrasicolus TaxID=184585 RepID=UPI002FD634C7